MSDTEKPRPPYALSVRRQDGYSVAITDVPGGLEVTIHDDENRIWRGVRSGIEDAVALAGRIVEEQKLIRQMREGDRLFQTRSDGR